MYKYPLFSIKAPAMRNHFAPHAQTDTQVLPGIVTIDTRIQIDSQSRLRKIRVSLTKLFGAYHHQVGSAEAAEEKSGRGGRASQPKLTAFTKVPSSRGSRACLVTQVSFGLPGEKKGNSSLVQGLRERAIIVDSLLLKEEMLLL